MPISVSCFSRFFRFSVLAVLSAAVLCVQASEPGEDATMPEDLLPELKTLLISALRQSPQMVQSEISISQAEAARYASSAQLLPQVVANASFAWNRIQPKSSSPGRIQTGRAENERG